MSIAALWSSETVEWATPPHVFEALHKEFAFTLDAAANAANALLPEWYGPDHPDPARRDGLTTDWAGDARGGTIYVNPPYGRAIGTWMAKADQESANATVVALIPARTDTQWWHRHVQHHEVRLLEGRLRFGGHKQFAPFPSAAIVMCNDAARHRYKQCSHCGIRFVPLAAKGRYCSGRCRTAAHRAAQRT